MIRSAGPKPPKKWGCDLLVLNLSATDRDGKPMTPAKAVANVKAVLAATGLPLIVFGPGQAELDNVLLVAVAEATKGERLVLGICEDKNYRTIVATAMANGHLVCARTPMDVNLSKQLNILISDMGMSAGFDPDGPLHRRPGLRHRIRLFGHGTPAPGSPAGRPDDPISDDRHPRI